MATEGELKTECGWRQSGTEDLNISRSALPQYPGHLFQLKLASSSCSTRTIPSSRYSKSIGILSSGRSDGLLWVLLTDYFIDWNDVTVDVDVDEAQYIINFESTVDKPFLFPKNNIDIYVNFDILSWHRCGISL